MSRKGQTHILSVIQLCNPKISSFWFKGRTVTDGFAMVQRCWHWKLMKNTVRPHKITGNGLSYNLTVSCKHWVDGKAKRKWTYWLFRDRALTMCWRAYFESLHGSYPIGWSYYTTFCENIPLYSRIVSRNIWEVNPSYLHMVLSNLSDTLWKPCGQSMKGRVLIKGASSHDLPLSSHKRSCNVTTQLDAMTPWFEVSSVKVYDFSFILLFHISHAIKRFAMITQIKWLKYTWFY